MTDRIRTSLEDFHNRLRILMAIDLHELVEAGVDMSRNTWAAFVLNPWKWFITASDEDAARIWAIMDRRSQPRDAAIREGIG